MDRWNRRHGKRIWHPKRIWRRFPWIVIIPVPRWGRRRW